MGKFKFKLKEERQTLKPKDVDPALLTRLEKQYGPINMEYDFFDKDLKTYFKTSSINPETGSVGHKIIKLASFADSLKKIYDAVDSLKALTGTPEGRGNKDVIDTLSKVKDAFNNYRSYLRKYYPDQYEVIKNELNEMSTIASNSGFTSGGEGENHTGPSPRKSTYGAYTQAGFKKVTEGPGATLGFGPKAGPEGVTKNKYVTDFKYKLVGKAGAQRAAQGLPANQVNEADTNVEQYLQDLNVVNPDNKKFIASRLMGFDEVETKLNQLLPLLQQAKHETMDYYRQNPESFSIVYGTDLANDYLNDLIELFKK